jgi:hypothetical protein
MDFEECTVQNISHTCCNTLVILRRVHCSGFDLLLNLRIVTKQLV